MSDYPVPAGMHVASLEVERSRFVAAVGHAPSLPLAREFIARRRAAEAGASHHVYAFRVGHGASVKDGMSDAGEPAGTAGPPCLAALAWSGMGDTCVVVSRFYGGRKLGTGGLVRAYGDAARLALAEVPRRLHVDAVDLALELPYSSYERVSRLLDAHGAELLTTDFGTSVALTLRIPRRDADALANAIRDATAGASRPRPLRA